VLLPHLNERQRRLYLGAEAASLGHGGIRLVARAAGTREATVSPGVTELDSGQAPLNRVRRPGAGRKRATDTDPGLGPALLALVEPDLRGDPMPPLRWTTLPTRKLADALSSQGHPISADTVGDVLRQQGFSLQSNYKTLEGTQSPDRDAQFRYINEQVTTHQSDGQPVISVDTKKKELIGEFQNSGREWRPTGDPVLVNGHDFPDKKLGKVVPYGVYDLAADAGWVNVGTDHDTAAFAVESLRRWWLGAGAAAYPDATRLLVTADAGGSSGLRVRAWKTGLAEFAAQTGLEITVCHFPPGTSTWNKIEHRLFNHITMNWRGRPLSSHEVVLNTIAATTTRTGLTVRAELGTGTCPLKVKISNAQLAALPLTRHDWHGTNWNYTPHPAPLEHTQPATAVPAQPVTQPRHPAQTWLAHPALTGLTTTGWDDLLARLTDPAYAPHTGHRPALTLPDRIAATILSQRFSLPATALAELFGTTVTTVNKALRDTRPHLTQAGHTTEPTTALATLTDLTTYATTAGATPQPTKNLRVNYLRVPTR
jgi:hypothetical protein